MIVLDNFNIYRRPKLGKSVGFARHIRLDVKLCSNKEQNCVFRCVVLPRTFLLKGGKMMFDNIGGKLKKLAIFECWIGIISSVISGIIL